jgi:uncharacterized protein (TIGR02646 family)
MFNVTRPQPGPDCSRDYRSKEVIDTLREIFYGKCYLCEDETSNPEVDHFIPRESDSTKTYEWDNLYYICGRCNGIKSTATDILDCCDAAIDVSKAIKCIVPSIPDDDIIVDAQDNHEATKNTANLLNRCYNEKNTGNRGITRELLHEKIFEEYSGFIKYRMALKSKRSLPRQRDEAKQHLLNMVRDPYPFSIFWKWHIWSDPYLSSVLEFGNS